VIDNLYHQTSSQEKCCIQFLLPEGHIRKRAGDVNYFLVCKIISYLICDHLYRPPPGPVIVL
jgi:hypothetical protein